MDIRLDISSPPVVERVAARVTPPPATREAAKTVEPQPVPRKDDVEQAADEINRFLKSSSFNIQFIVDAASSDIVVRVVDAETSEIIRQMPSEEMLVISKCLDRMRGLLIAKKT
jgi:flagellar protein FlaG